MSIAALIVKTYRSPGQVMQRWLAAPRHEGRLLVMLIGGCGFIFLSSLPYALAAGGDAPAEARIGAGILAWLVIAPLTFYGLAAVSHLAARLGGGTADGYGARLALFWSVLAAAPLWLLNGAALTLPAGPLPTLLGAIALLGFLALWLLCFRAAFHAPSKAIADV